MIWRPTISELEKIVETGTARLSNEKIAARLGVSLKDFIEWCHRTAGAVEPPDLPPAANDLAKQPEAKARILAERLFETSHD